MSPVHHTKLNTIYLGKKSKLAKRTKTFTKDFKKAGFNELMQKEGMVEDQSIGIKRDKLVSQDKQVFNITDVRNFRIYLEGTVTMQSGTITATVEHNLGYIPTFLAYGQPSSLSSTEYYKIPFYEYDVINMLDRKIQADLTDTAIVFRRSPTFSSGTLKISYRIFREKASA